MPTAPAPTSPPSPARRSSPPAQLFEEALQEASTLDELRPPHSKIGSMPAAMKAGAGACGGIGGSGGGGGDATPPYCRSLFKSPRQIWWQLRLEWALLRKEWRWVLAILAVEYVHLVSRNLVYYIQGKVYRQNTTGADPANDKDFPPGPLKDLGFMVLGKGRWLPTSLEWLETFWIGASGVYLVLLWLTRVFLNLRTGGPKVAIAGRDDPSRPVLVIPMPAILMFRQMVMVAALAIPLRCITFLTTLLPPPAAHCQRAWTPPQEVSKIFNPFEAPRTGCGDQMFSGHVLHGMLVALMALRYFPFHCLVPLLAFGFVAALGVLLVVFRAHYTADVITAVYVTWGGWLLLQPYEPRDLNRYGIRANVLIRPTNYQSVGTDPWRAREVMAQFEEAEAAEEEQQAVGGVSIAAMEEGKATEPAAGAGGGEEAAARGEGCVGLCRRCRARLPVGGGGGGAGGDGGRHRARRSKVVYLPPLPPSCPPLVEHADLTESARAFERLPW